MHVHDYWPRLFLQEHLKMCFITVQLLDINLTEIISGVELQLDYSIFSPHEFTHVGVP